MRPKEMGVSGHICSSSRLRGSRIAAGVTVGSKSGSGSSPVEYFLVDPEAPGLTAQAVMWIQIGRAWHIFDIGGEQHYPLPADFLEEVRQVGSISRRLPSGGDHWRFSSQPPASYHAQGD
jgi:hypothetical protein